MNGACGHERRRAPFPILYEASSERALRSRLRGGDHARRRSRSRERQGVEKADRRLLRRHLRHGREGVRTVTFTDPQVGLLLGRDFVSVHVDSADDEPTW